MKPIMIHVSRKIRLPTKYQLVHKWKTDWKNKVLIINYQDSKNLFGYFNKNNPIKTDAQFAKFLYERLGEGVYKCLAWRKGRRGFWGFLYLELNVNGFRRLKRNKSQEQKDIENNVKRLKQLRDKLHETQNADDKQEINEEIESIQDMIDIDEEIEDFSKKETKRGPTPYLKQTQPVYAFHSYEGYKKNKIEQVSGEPSLW